MSKVYIPYARVSSEEQQEKGNSIPNQVERTTRYIAQVLKGIALEPITDDVSGTSLKRPGLNKARSLLREGKASGLVVTRGDRLTRNLKDSLILREEFAEAGIELHFVERGEVKNTAADKMTSDIEATFAEFWRNKIVEDTHSGRVRHVKRGGMPTWGSPPYGYRVENGGIVIDEDQAALIRWIFVEMMNGSSVTGLAKRLTREHVDGPGVGKVSNAGKQWFPVTLTRIMKNPAIKGEWSYSGVPVALPPILTPDEFEEVGRRIAVGRDASMRNSNPNYIFRGMLICRDCGRRMHGQTEKLPRRETIRYMCPHKLDANAQRCSKQKCIRQAVILPLVWGAIEAALTDDKVFKQGLKEAREVYEQRTSEARAELVSVDKSIKRVEDEVLSLVKSLAKTSGFVSEITQKRIDELNEAHSELIAHKRELEKSADGEAMNLESLAEFRRKIVLGLKTDSPEGIRRVFEALELKVYVSDEGLDIECILPVKIPRLSYTPLVGCYTILLRLFVVLGQSAHRDLRLQFEVLQR